MGDLRQTAGRPAVLRSPERTWRMLWDRKPARRAVAALHLPNIRKKSMYSRTH